MPSEKSTTTKPTRFTKVKPGFFVNFVLNTFHHHKAEK